MERNRDYWRRWPLTRKAIELTEPADPLAVDDAVWENRSILDELARTDPALEPSGPGVWVAMKRGSTVREI